VQRSHVCVLGQTHSKKTKKKEKNEKKKRMNHCCNGHTLSARVQEYTKKMMMKIQNTV